MKSKIEVGIIGGGGYTAGELIRILTGHPDVNIKFVYSQSQGGKEIHTIHEDLLFLGNKKFASEIENADVLFLCQGHGKAKKFMEEYNPSDDTLVIDLGNDFRIDQKDWVYGMPELYREKIAGSKRIANPGCFATALQLALLPLAKEKLLKEDIHISAITGSTGAGQKLQPTTHFSWRQNNLSVYKAFSHQHEAEVYQSLIHLSPNYPGKIRFLPHRGDFTRGIYGSIYTPSELPVHEILELFLDFYDEAPFVHVTEKAISLKSVVNTNHCFLQISKHEDVVLVHTAIDNLVKGASGQAVHNMNIALGIPEQAGLVLKPTAY
jgi:N-acetyl-gamma-glutamyl-phosphate reductase